MPTGNIVFIFSLNSEAHPEEVCLGSSMQILIKGKRAVFPHKYFIAKTLVTRLQLKYMIFERPQNLRIFLNCLIDIN